MPSGTDSEVGTSPTYTKGLTKMSNGGIWIIISLRPSLLFYFLFFGL